MSRIYKFRAWDKKKKKMIHNCGIRFTDCGYLLVMPAFMVGGGDSYPLDDFELMQFTGLHDKNGVEIWEGDIVALTANAYHGLDLTMKLAAKGHRAEVIYSEGCFIWYVGNFMYPLNQLIPKTVDQEVKYMFLDALNCDHKGLTCEVLGNVHQHPHLLTEKV